MIDFPPDWTFFFQIVIFLVVWAFLRRFLFEPNLAVLETRERRSVGALQNATRIQAEAEKIGDEYKSRLATTRASAMQQVEAIYREVEEQTRAVLESARVDADRTMKTLRESLEQEVTHTRKNLEDQAPAFAHEIGEKLLGRPLTHS